MSGDEGERLRFSAAALAREFDLGFSRAADLEPPVEENLLILQLQSRPFAVRATGLRAIAPTPRIACVPSSSPALLGIAGIRGELVPVFDLAHLLGISPEERGLRWCLLVGESERAALAFRHFDGFVRCPASAVSRAEARDGLAPFLEEVVRLERGVLSIIDVARIFSGLQSPAAQ